MADTVLHRTVHEQGSVKMMSTLDFRETPIMTHSVVSDLDLQALVDNELSPEDEKRVRAAIRDQPTLLRRYKELTIQKELIFAAWQDGGLGRLH